MARITAYESTDKQLFRDRKEYLRHESNLAGAKKIQEILTGQIGAEEAEKVVGTLVNGLTLNVLRDILNTPFKPGATDEDEAPADSAPAADASATGEDAATGKPADGKSDADDTI